MDREAAQLLGLEHERVRRLDFFGVHEQIVLVHGAEAADFALHRLGVAHCLHHVAGPGLPLRVKSVSVRE